MSADIPEKFSTSANKLDQKSLICSMCSLWTYSGHLASDLPTFCKLMAHALAILAISSVCPRLSLHMARWKASHCDLVRIFETFIPKVWLPFASLMLIVPLLCIMAMTFRISEQNLDFLLLKNPRFPAAPDVREKPFGKLWGLPESFAFYDSKRKIEHARLYGWNSRLRGLRELNVIAVMGASTKECRRLCVLLCLAPRKWDENNMTSTSAERWSSDFSWSTTATDLDKYPYFVHYDR